MTASAILGRTAHFCSLAPKDFEDFNTRNDALSWLEDFLLALEKGEVRAAQYINGKWQAEALVKQGILLAFRLSKNVPMPHGPFSFADRSVLTLQQLKDPSIRMVPGGSAVRRGAFVGESVTIMPPAYINIGAYVGKNSMVDSHALVGTCAQIGEGVHISAAAQIGGVLEPASAVPVIVEDGVLIGGNCGIYEGVIIKSRAVIAAGVILTSGTKVYDLVNEKIITASENYPLQIPAGAVVVSGSRPAQNSFAQSNALSIYTPLIVKYRDEKTDAKTALEPALR